MSMERRNEIENLSARENLINHIDDLQIAQNENMA